MSDYNDSDIDMSVNVETDISKEMEALNNLEQKAKSVTEAFKKLGNAYQNVTQQQVSGFQHNALPTSWDSLYKRELMSMSDPQKRDAFLRMMDQTTHENIKITPASTTGKHHPSWANIEGGLVRHSKAVAQGAVTLATMYGYAGNKDDLLIAGLGHDAQKLGRFGKFYDPMHAEHGAANLKAFGLTEAANLAVSHMGTAATGARKDAMAPETQGQRILAESDWLMSRKYAEDFVKWDDKGEMQYMDIEGVRKEAIRRGEAKEGKDGYLDILGSVEDQEKAKAKAAKEWEKSWNNVWADSKKLYGVLLDIAKLGLAQIAIGGKVVEAGSNALSSGGRILSNMGGEEVLQNRLAASIVGLGANSINDEVAALSLKRGSFSIAGEAGDLLPMALAGNLDKLLLSGEDMNKVYWDIANSFAEQISKARAGGDQKKVKELMFLTEKTLGGNARRLVDYSVANNIMPSSLKERDTLQGGMWNWQEDIEGVNREFKKSMDSIKDSFTGLYTHFMAVFGNPVTTWFASALQKIMTRQEVFAEITNRTDRGLFNPTYSNEYDAEIARQRRELVERQQVWRNNKGKVLSSVITGTPQTQIWQKQGLKPDPSNYYRELRNAGFYPPEGMDLLSLQAWAREQLDYKKEKDSSDIKAFDSAHRLKNAYRGDDKAADNWKSIQYLGMQNTPEAKKLFEGIKTYLPDYVTGHQGRDPLIGDMLEMIMSDVLNKLITPEKGVEDIRKLSEKADVSVNMNLSFPNATDKDAIKAGILDSVNGIETALASYSFG